jgi:hypothetical protein
MGQVSIPRIANHKCSHRKSCELRIAQDILGWGQTRTPLCLKEPGRRLILTRFMTSPSIKRLRRCDSSS